MELSCVALHKSLFLLFTHAILMKFSFARESVWGLKLTQASCDCAMPIYVYMLPFYRILLLLIISYGNAFLHYLHIGSTGDWCKKVYMFTFLGSVMIRPRRTENEGLLAIFCVRQERGIDLLLDQLEFSVDRGKTTASVLHDAQHLLNMQQQI